MTSATGSADIISASEKAGLRNVDRLLPSQPVMRKLFADGAADFHERLETVLHSILPHTSVDLKWNIEFKPGVTYASLGSDMATLHFYQLLVALAGIRHVLELGTYVGVSALCLAEAVGPHGSVTTVERGEEFHAIACRNFARNGMAERIHPLLDGAADVLRRHVAEDRRYDMILVDAAKEEYAAMLAPALSCLAPGGLLVVDDIFMNGDALNERPVTDKGCGVRDLLAKVAALAPDFSRVILPMGNGILLIRKPGRLDSATAGR